MASGGDSFAGGASGWGAGGRLSDVEEHPSRRSCIDRWFKVTERGSTIRTELNAGVVNFVANSYLLVVIPQILAHPGEKTDYDRRLEVDYFFGFIIATAAASIVSGVISNLPVPIGVGVGAATYFAFSLRSRDLVENYNTTSGLPDNPVDPDGNVAPDRVWDVLAATTCFVAAIFMLVIALTDLPWRVFRLIPPSVKGAMPVGLGMLLSLAGFQLMELVVVEPGEGEGGGLQMGDLTTTVILSLMGVFIACFLHAREWKSAIVLPLATFTALAWLMVAFFPDVAAEHLPDTKLPTFDNYTSRWIYLSDTFVEFDNGFSFSKAALPSLSLWIICLVDSGGITYAVADVAGLIKDKGTPRESIPGAYGVFVAAALGSAVAALKGLSPTIVLGEAFAGVLVGGRTGLTAIFFGCCVLLAAPLAPFAVSIPLFASTPVLVLLGVDLLHLVKFLDMETALTALPAFLVIALMPYLYSIDKAIIAGLIGHYAMRFLTALSDPCGRQKATPTSWLRYMLTGQLPGRDYTRRSLVRPAAKGWNAPKVGPGGADGKAVSASQAHTSLAAAFARGLESMQSSMMLNAPEDYRPSVRSPPPRRGAPDVDEPIRGFLGDDAPAGSQTGVSLAAFSD